MNSPNLFEQHLSLGWPTGGLWQQVRVLVAVSGGADSVALVRAMHRLSRPELGPVAIAHFNHGLRPTSQRDELFVADLAQSLGLECYRGHWQTVSPSQTPDGIEAAAREARYSFLVATAERIGARYLVTAHNADDQAETLLHHLVRGTGILGLAGMPRVRVLSPAVTLIRPMLEIRRKMIESYLDSLGQNHVHDESNQDLNLTRNRIRHELLPLLARDYSPTIVEALLRLSSLASDTQRVISSLADEHLERVLLTNTPEQATIDCRPLQSIDRHLVREVFVALWRHNNWKRQAMRTEHWNLLADFVLLPKPEAPASSVLPDKIRAQKTGEQLVLSRL